MKRWFRHRYHHSDIRQFVRETQMAQVCGTCSRRFYPKT